MMENLSYIKVPVPGTTVIHLTEYDIVNYVGNKKKERACKGLEHQVNH